MRPLFLLLATLTLAACAGSPRPLVPDASGPYAGIPHVAGDNLTAEANPVAPTGDDRLDNFLADLAAAIDRHDWYGVAEFADPRRLQHAAWPSKPRAWMAPQRR